MQKRILSVVAAASVILFACPTVVPAPKCTPQSCANGCCSPSGECVTAETAEACGLNGVSCSSCASQVCASGQCTTPVTDAGAGDAGVDCAHVNLDPVLGTLILKSGATVAQAGALPAGIVAVGASGSTLYGLSKDKTVHELGRLPDLVAGPALVQVVSPDDVAADAGVYLGGYLAVSGAHLLAGYTKAGADYPGQVMDYNLADAGVQYTSAPGNYAAVGFGEGFLINGTALGAAVGAGAYVLDAHGASPFASFDSGWQASSGVVGVTSDGVALVGYFSSADFKNYVRAVPPDVYAGPLQAHSALSLADTAVVLAADDLADFTTFQNDAIVVRGGYDASPPYASFTRGVERLPLTVTGSGSSQTISVGTAIPLIEAQDRCTKVVFAVGTAAGLLLGVEDPAGRRLVQLSP